MNLKLIIITVVSVVAILGGGMYYIYQSEKPTITGLDDFAKCISQKGWTMYGAYWCPHCQAEKKAFGSSFQYINYIECTQNAKLCTEKNIQSYPTWIGPQDKRQTGELGPENLATLTSCELPKK